MSYRINFFVTGLGIAVLSYCIYTTAASHNSVIAFVNVFLLISLIFNSLATHYRLKTRDSLNQLREIHKENADQTEKFQRQMHSMQTDVELASDAKEACAILTKIRLQKR